MNVNEMKLKNTWLTIFFIVDGGRISILCWEIRVNPERSNPHLDRQDNVLQLDYNCSLTICWYGPRLVEQWETDKMVVKVFDLLICQYRPILVEQWEMEMKGVWLSDLSISTETSKAVRDGQKAWLTYWFVNIWICTETSGAIRDEH